MRRANHNIKDSNGMKETYFDLLTLQEGASGMVIKKGGGAFNARPYKTHLKALLSRFFCLGRVGG